MLLQLTAEYSLLGPQVRLEWLPKTSYLTDMNATSALTPKPESLHHLISGLTTKAIFSMSLQGLWRSLLRQVSEGVVGEVLPFKRGLY